MTAPQGGIRAIAGMILLCGVSVAVAQVSRPSAGAEQARPDQVTLVVVDFNGQAVPGAQVTVQLPGQPPLYFHTDSAGRCAWAPPQATPYKVLVQKPGFYQSAAGAVDAQTRVVRIALAHEQTVQEEVNVTASAPGIDTERVSDLSTMGTAEIVNIPFPTDHDIRNLLPFTPGVVADFSNQVHVAGGETYMTLDTLDGFDIRSAINGTLDMRVSTDAVHSIDTETTRYPVEYGRATGGVIAFTSGMGDNHMRFNATNFIPSVQQNAGIHFSNILPRITLSGPIRRDRAWFSDGLDAEYDYIFIPELPPSANTDNLIRGSNLIKSQINLGPRNSLYAALLFNDFHSPFDGLSAILPQQSTDNHDILAWLPYVRDQEGFEDGVVLDIGLGVVRYREGFEPHGTLPYDITPELPTGSNPETLTTRSQRTEGNANLFFPTRQWEGTHQFRAGIDLDHIGYSEYLDFAPVNYVREDRSLARLSTFPQFASFSRDNDEVGAFVEDRWSPRGGLLLTPGIRFDWDAIIRHPLFSPRIALSYSPPGAESSTKISAGIGIYYEHTQMEYLARAFAGIRYDTYYAANGTPQGPASESSFTENNARLREARALNWSVGLEHKLPGQIFANFNYIQKRVENEFVYANQSGTGGQPGTYALTNGRQDHYYSVEFDARRSFAGGYTIFGAYTRSSATTNAALDYVPWISILGPQQGGPLYFDVPNRVISWGWLPTWAPKMPSVHKNWDFVYTVEWHTGFPFDSIDSSADLVGLAGSRRFPDFVSISPGLEWRFHFRGRYFGLRGIAENVTKSLNPYIVYNNVDSPLYGTFTQSYGRAFTTRIRLIQSK